MSKNNIQLIKHLQIYLFVKITTILHLKNLCRFALYIYILIYFPQNGTNFPNTTLIDFFIRHIHR